MAASSSSTLSPFKKSVLDAFFRREGRFFLTGGAALAGFHLGHRPTDDLDLFVTEDVLDDGEAVLRAVADELGASIEAVQTAPDIRRRLLRRGDETVIVDLVRERVPQLVRDKPVLHGIRVDPPDEIFANKLCALLTRAEVRDLVDVRALEKAGFKLNAAMAAGSRKDGGLTPGQLAWVLSQMEIGPEASLPGSVPASEIRDYLHDLVRRLARQALPSE